ncbi:U3 small nucleolar RNA-associated protein 19, partial [Phenoliferia sp. Uapishka_3]
MVKSSLPKASQQPKRPRAEVVSAIPETVREITALAAKLPPSAPINADLNPLADLVSLFQSLSTSLPPSTTTAAKETNRQAVHTALHALKAVFESLISHGRIHGVAKGKGTKEVDAASKSVEAVKVWLRERWTLYVTKAAEVAGAHWDAGVRNSALNALLSLVRTEAAFLTSLHPTRASQWPSPTFALVVKGLLIPPGDGELLEDTKQEWMKWWDRYDDVRYHFLKEAAILASSHASTSTEPTPPYLAANLLTILESLTSMPTVASEINEWWCAPPVASKLATAITSGNGKASKKRKLNSLAPAVVDDGSTGVFDSSSEEEDEDASKPKLSSKDRKRLLPPVLTLQAHRRAFQDCWLGLLSLPLDESEAKRVLVILHRQVLPHMTDPKRTMDWLVDSTNSGGTVGILALNGLFTLMTKHNLEYPDFFTKLYALLDRDVMHVRYRPRFFRLLEVFMGSSHLPSALVAAFIKRLARLSLSAPPAAIVTVIPFIYNLLKLHAGCMTMIHRPNVDDVDSDPFDADEKDPIKTGASDSSLWELATLQSHYLASVSGLAKIFGEVMSKQNYAMEDFLDHSYSTMFEVEATRKIRSAPAMAPVPQRQPIGSSFFPPTDAPEHEDGPVDIISQLWTF